MNKLSYANFTGTTLCRVLMCVIFVAAATMAVAQAGQLDPTFGSNGIFSDNFQGGLNLATAVALQSDGKMLVGGEVGDFGGVLRLNTNGTVDNSFGTAGLAQLKFSDVDSIVTGIAIQPDGKVLVVGTGVPGGGDLDRLNADGSVDNSFGSQGVAHIDGNPGQLVLQPDGKIIVVFSIFVDNALASQMQRFNSNGQPDTSFGTDGTAPLVAFGAITLQSDGKFLVSSSSIARYNGNGSPDGSFGAFAQAAVLPNLSAAIALETNGQIVTAGSTTAGLSLTGNSSGFGVQRFNSNGSIDATFGTRGAAITGFQNSPATGAGTLAIQSNGDVVAAGDAGSAGIELSFALVRYLTSGKLDTTFGTGGRVITSFGSGNDASISAIAIQADGKIVAVGSVQPVGQEYEGTWEVARYLGQ